MSDPTATDVAKEIIDHTEGGRDPCPVCERRKRDHTETEARRCWVQIEAAGYFREVSMTLSRIGAIDHATLKDNFRNSDPSKELPGAIELRDFLDTEWLTAYLFGDFGTGKTFVSHCVLNEAMKRRQYVVDITGVDLAKRLRQFKADPLVACIKRYSMVLIDDIDKPSWDAKSIDGLWDILNHRSKHGLKTILTANVHPGAFRDLIAQGSGGNLSKAESLMQRIHPTLLLEFRGESMR